MHPSKPLRRGQELEIRTEIEQHMAKTLKTMRLGARVRVDPYTLSPELYDHGTTLRLIVFPYGPYIIIMPPLPPKKKKNLC